MFKIVAISDTHNKHWNIDVPDGDLLIHCGDATMGGTIKEIVDFNNWLGTLPHKRKLFTPGNHDFLFQDNLPLAKSLLPNAEYLENEGTAIETTRKNGDNLYLWASPYTPEFMNWAFMKSRGDEIARIWRQIPVYTDILVTHGPPFGILDETVRHEHVGCYDLGRAVSIKIKPQLHLFGHIHEAYGILEHVETKYINCSILDDYYSIAHEPVVLEV